MRALVLILLVSITHGFLVGDIRLTRDAEEDEPVCLLKECLKAFEAQRGPAPDWRYGDIISQADYERCRTHIPELYTCLTDTVRDEQDALCENCTTKEVSPLLHAMHGGEEALGNTICVRPCRLSLRTHCSRLCFPLHKKLMAGTLNDNDRNAVTDCTQCVKGVGSVCPHIFPNNTEKWTTIFNSAINGCPVVEKYMKNDCPMPTDNEYQDVCYRLGEWASQVLDCKEADIANMVGCEDMLRLRQTEVKDLIQEVGIACAQFYQGQAFERQCASRQDTGGPIRHWKREFLLPFL